METRRQESVALAGSLGAGAALAGPKPRRVEARPLPRRCRVVLVSFAPCARSIRCLVSLFSSLLVLGAHALDPSLRCLVTICPLSGERCTLHLRQ